MKKINLSVVILVVACLTIAVKSQAWHYQQHLIICEAAWQELTPAAKDMVMELHQRANEVKYYRKFSDSCGWADDVRDTTHRETADYHFVNVSFREDSFDYSRDCVANDCVVSAINRYRRILNTPAVLKNEKQQQANALRFLAHFVADLHQPLHVSYRKDRGGNLTIVTWLNGENKNLHTVWDSLIPQQAGLDTFADAKYLLKDVPDGLRETWSKGSASQWGNESYQLTRSYVYQYVDGTPLKNGDTLTQTYVNGAKPLVREQMRKAAVRLAFILNGISGG